VRAFAVPLPASSANSMPAALRPGQFQAPAFPLLPSMADCRLSLGPPAAPAQCPTTPAQASSALLWWQEGSLCLPIASFSRLGRLALWHDVADHASQTSLSRQWPRPPAHPVFSQPSCLLFQRDVQNHSRFRRWPLALLPRGTTGVRPIWLSSPSLHCFSQHHCFQQAA